MFLINHTINNVSQSPVNRYELDPYPTRLPIMHELTSTYPLVASINHTSLIYIKAIDV